MQSVETTFCSRPVHGFNNTSPDPPQYQRWMTLQQSYMQGIHRPDSVASAWDDEDHPENYSGRLEDNQDQQRENTSQSSWHDDDDQRENYPSEDDDDDDDDQESREPLSVIFMIAGFRLDDMYDELVNVDGGLVSIREMSFLDASEGGLNGDSNLIEETILHHLKTRHYQKPDDEEEADQICAVCQSDFEDKELLGTLVCGHEFHAHCINRWLLHKNICPICRHIAIQEQES